MCERRGEGWREDRRYAPSPNASCSSDIWPAGASGATRRAFTLGGATPMGDGGCSMDTMTVATSQPAGPQGMHTITPVLSAGGEFVAIRLPTSESLAVGKREQGREWRVSKYRSTRQQKQHTARELTCLTQQPATPPSSRGAGRAAERAPPPVRWPPLPLLCCPAQALLAWTGTRRRTLRPPVSVAAALSLCKAGPERVSRRDMLGGLAHLRHACLGRRQCVCSWASPGQRTGAGSRCRHSLLRVDEG